MTNEEAQIVIGNIPLKPEVLDDCYSITEYQEAKAMAIKALEQQHCEDCISRQAVINAIANTCFWLSADNWEELMECIDSLPSVTPQPKVKSADCLYCNRNNVLPGNYCKWCGARMQEVEE